MINKRTKIWNRDGNKATYDSGTVEINNSGTDNALFINQDGNGIALNIDNSSILLSYQCCCLQNS